MNIWEIDKLQLFLIFFIPGFISMKVYDLIVPRERRDFSKGVVEAIGYSSLNFALLSWLIILIHSGSFSINYRVIYYILLFCILFIFPVIWPIVFFKIAEWEPIARRISHPIQKPWDWVFRKRESFWVIVHFADGRRIGGRYDTQSFASSFPSPEQIYLEEVWRLDENGAFIEPIERSRGMIVLSKDIIAVEFFEK